MLTIRQWLSCTQGIQLSGSGACLLKIKYKYGGNFESQFKAYKGELVNYQITFSNIHCRCTLNKNVVLISHQFSGGSMVLKWVVMMKKMWKQNQVKTHYSMCTSINKRWSKTSCGIYCQQKGFIPIIWKSNPLVYMSEISQHEFYNMMM